MIRKVAILANGGDVSGFNAVIRAIVKTAENNGVEWYGIVEGYNGLLKNEYDLSFITVEEVKKEKDLENALANNITRFLLELGSGFSSVGRQMELQMPGGQTFFPDLVFYHIPQHRYVVVELKAVKFIPEFAGKLNFYVTAADKLLRGEGDNQSVGLLICKSTDKTIVEWSLQDIQKPLGVASYQLQEVYSHRLHLNTRL